eukprot:9977031-Karenia_brevis.AAC.1
MLRVAAIHDPDTILDTSITSFVDDVAATFITGNNHEVAQMTKKASLALDKAFEPNGFLQNIEKKQTIFCPKGKESKQAVSSMHANTNMTNSARYLGPVLSWHGGAHEEITRRIQFAWGAFKQYS